MPLKIVRGNHWEIIGRGAVLLSSPPSTAKNKELYTGTIVEETALLSKSHALIEGGRKQTRDPPTSEHVLSEFQASMKELVDEFHIKLILAIVGTEEPGIDLLVSENSLDSDSIVALLKKKLGGSNLRVGKAGASMGVGLTEVQSFQIGLGSDERGFRRDQIISSIVDLIGQVNVLLGSSEGDERAGSILD